MTIGIRTSSFQGLLAPGSDPVDVLIRAIQACGARECELFAPQVEAQFGGPHGGHGSMSAMSPQMMRRELRKWRLRTPPRYFEAIGSRFKEAGIAIAVCDHPVDASFSDQEIERGVEMARALGAGVLTVPAAPGLTARIAPFAARHHLTVAFSGDTSPDAVQASSSFRIVADTAQLASSNVSPVDYVRAHHAQIAIVRVSCGGSDAPARQVVDAIAHDRWPIGVFAGVRDAANPVDAVKQCLAVLHGS